MARLKETARNIGIGATGLVLIGFAAFRGAKAVESITDKGYNTIPVAASATPTPSEAAGTPNPKSEFGFIPAERNGSQWALHNPDGTPVSIQGIEGFTPDSTLVTAPEQPLQLDPAKFADFQSSLNDPNHPLVGYTYGENDQSDNPDYEMTLQAPLYSWTVLTGEETNIPGIGHVKANPGGAVEVMIMNITDRVIEWGTNRPTVMLKHGFKGTGRIWDGGNVVEDERGITSHYVSRLEQGVTLPGESGFIGQCNKPVNCSDIKVVSVIYRQWGNNPDGTPRFQFQLLRAEQVTK